jgi:hypothetical protein
MADDKTVESIFQRIDDIADLLSRIDERTSFNTESIGKFDDCITGVKQSLNALQVEVARIDVRLTLKTGFIAILCGMIPPTITMIILFFTGRFNCGG